MYDKLLNNKFTILIKLSKEKMLLKENIEVSLLKNIKLLIKGERAPVINIGSLTEEQYQEVNEQRSKEGYPSLDSPEILYMGRHHVKSRHFTDGYSAEDILEQIISVMKSDSIISLNKQTLLERKSNDRLDNYGNYVRDVGVLELTTRKPRAELFSVIPKGDDIKPNSQAQKKAS